MTTVDQLQAMSPEELEVTKKKLSKIIVTKIIVSAGVTVAAHVISTFVIDKLESRKENEIEE